MAIDPRDLVGRSETIANIVANAYGEADHVAAIRNAAAVPADLDGATVYAPCANARGRLEIAETDLGEHLIYRWESWVAGRELEIPIRLKVTGRGWYNGGLEVPSLKVRMDYIDPSELDASTASGYRETKGVEGWIL